MSILRIAVKAITTLLVAATLALAAAGPAAAAPATSADRIVAAPARITSFEWVAGQQQWIEPNKSRLSRTLFTVDPDGTFVMRQPDGYPTLVGSVSSDGTFRAAYRSTTGSTGSVSADALGQMGVESGVPVLNLTYAAGSASAAVINGIQFGANSTKAYRATMTLRKI